MKFERQLRRGFESRGTKVFLYSIEVPKDLMSKGSSNSIMEDHFGAIQVGIVLFHIKHNGRILSMTR